MRICILYLCRHSGLDAKSRYPAQILYILNHSSGWHTSLSSFRGHVLHFRITVANYCHLLPSYLCTYTSFNGNYRTRTIRYNNFFITICNATALPNTVYCPVKKWLTVYDNVVHCTIHILI